MANPHRYPLLHAPHGDLDVDPQQILAGNAQRIFLADFNANDNIDYTIIENPTEVEIRGTPYMTLRRSYTSSFERREYFPRAAGQKIVHYGPNDHPYRKDMALAQEAGDLLADDIDGDSEAAANGRDQLAGDVWAYEPP
ncbi:uncharacterized protein LOC127771929 [Oryza glaberrima]|uniref:uncharacterized protein LOC127771929 n=1 Tax=Oryza glaberrima TaxID=4538 RepID=UPI00023E05DF|nr:uncharacterized protein LOC127771929 [Oryza glaberrima]